MMKPGLFKLRIFLMKADDAAPLRKRGMTSTSKRLTGLSRMIRASIMPVIIRAWQEGVLARQMEDQRKAFIEKKENVCDMAGCMSE